MMIGDIEKPMFNILKSPNLKRKQKKKFVPLNERLKLETVLGLTVTSNAGLSLDSNTGNLAYFSGCVSVLYNPRKNKQSHLFNSSKKPLTCLSYSRDGRYLATGESGHQPAVRVWDLEEMIQVAEFEGHKFGIRCVAFSPNLKYIVSVGYHHDMVVNVWNWKKNIKVASNKVASKVMDVAFSEDGSMFVTAGNRHIKFWYLNASKSKNQLETLPLLGRNGILGEHQNNLFCGVCCHRRQDRDVDDVFAITEAGLLCQFNEKRVLAKWVSLKTNKATSLSMGDQYIFVGCSGGFIRIFSSSTLNFISSLPLPHSLGVDVALNIHGQGDGPDRSYADTVAVRYDEASKRLCSIYDDRSLYLWDVSDVKKIGKNKSCLYHNGAVWGVDIYPGNDASILPSNSFVTCGNDDTIRFWRIQNNNNNANDAHLKNIYSNELIKVLYIDKDLSNLRDVKFNQGGKTDKNMDANQDKNGIRSIKFRPNGKQLASGDRVGNIRIHSLETMVQTNQIEAHDSEVLCLEFTSTETGLNLLVSGSRDRLIHVFDAHNNYSLIQTLDEHSAAVTAVKFVSSDLHLGLVSCSSDKSVLFRTASVDPNFHFTLTRHVVTRTTLYDMEVDVNNKFVAIACQDRNIRIYNIRTGKMKKCYTGSIGTDGLLVRLQLDSTSSLIATSSSDKTLALFNFFSGECLGHMMGHSEVPTGLKFFDDLKHMVSVGADGCMFVWKLDSEMIEQMNKRRAQLKDQIDAQPMSKTVLSNPLPTFESEVKSNGLADDNSFVFRFSPGQLPAWARTKFSKESTQQPSSSSSSSISWNVPLVPKGKWAQNVDTQNYPIPPSVPYFGWKSLIKTDGSPGVSIIREGEDHDEDDEDEDDEFSRDRSHLVADDNSSHKPDEDGDDEDDDEDGGGDDDDDGEKESNDNDNAKEDTIFLPTSEPLTESCSESLFEVEENNLIKVEDGSGENENYLSSFEDDAELKSVPSSPSSSDQQAKPLFCSEDNDVNNFELSHETFEMTLKRLEFEMTNRSEVRCSLSAKYFNNSVNNDCTNDDNRNNNASFEGKDSIIGSKISSLKFLQKDTVEEPAKRQQLNVGSDNLEQANKCGSLGRRHGRSLAGSDLRLAVKQTTKAVDINTSSSLSSPSYRKWKSLVDVRMKNGDDSDEGKVTISKPSIVLGPGNINQSQPRISVERGVKLKSILRSQTPNILMNNNEAASNWSKQQNSSAPKKTKKSTATISMMTLNSKTEEVEPRKPIMRVRSYRMATESSQAKQQGGTSSNQQQTSKRLLPHSVKQFQSTPNLSKDEITSRNDDNDDDDDDEIRNHLSKPQSSINISSRALQANKELERLDEDLTEVRFEPRRSTFTPIDKRFKVVENFKVKDVAPQSSSVISSSSNEEIPQFEGSKVSEDIEVPERDFSTSRKITTNTGLLKSTNQMPQSSRPHSSNIQLKSQLQKRSLPSDPSNKLNSTYIEPRAISSTKLQLKEFSNLGNLSLVEQKVEDHSSKRNTIQSKWGSLRSPTNINITFARPASRNRHACSPDPLQNWVKRAETIQHQWEFRNNKENGHPESPSNFLGRKKILSLGDEESRRRSTNHKRSESTDSITSQESSSPTRNMDIEFPMPDRSRRSTSTINFDWHTKLEDRRLKHIRTSSADGSIQSDDTTPREGEPISNLKDSRIVKNRKDGIRPRVVFSPIVCMLSSESTPEEERASEACERLNDAVNKIATLYEELREFREPDDPVLVKMRGSVEDGHRKLQSLIGPLQSSTQLDKCAEDLTMKMYELIRKKMDNPTSSF